MICGKVGASAGPSADIAGKLIWDNNKEKLEFGAQNKFIAGAEIEGQINWKRNWARLENHLFPKLENTSVTLLNLEAVI